MSLRSIYNSVLIDGAKLDGLPSVTTAPNDATKFLNGQGAWTSPVVAGSVSSVFGRTGAVIAQAGDYTAATVTNAVDQTGSYANPTWITSLAGSKISGVVASAATCTGNAATVTNGVYTTGSYTDPAWITSLAGSKVSGAINGVTLSTAAGATNFLAGDGTYKAVSGGSGTVTTISIAPNNGFAGSVANPTTTPVITLTTSVTGIIKGSASAMVSAVAGTDYLTPTGSGAALTGITATQVGAPSGSGTSTGTNTGDQTNISGNAATVTNGVYTTGSYADPAWITSLAGSKVSGAINGITLSTAAGATNFLAGDGTYKAVAGFAWGATATGTSGTGVALTVGNSASAGAIAQSIILGNTQSNALNLSTIDAGTSAIGHAGQLINIYNASTSARGIKIDGSTTGTGLGIEITGFAKVSGDFRPYIKLGTNTIFGSDGRSPNGVISGIAGDICINGGSSKIEYCVGTTTWNALGDLTWGASASNSGGIGMQLTLTANANGYCQYLLFDNTQNQANKALAIDLGTSAQGHTGIEVKSYGAITSQTGILVDLSTTGTGTAYNAMGGAAGAGVAYKITPTSNKSFSIFYGSPAQLDLSANAANAQAFSVTSIEQGSSIVARTYNMMMVDHNRTNTRTSTTLTDNYNLGFLKRTSVQNGAGGTLVASGSVFSLQNVATQTAGTLTDSVAVLKLTQDNNSTGGHILFNSYSGAPTTDGTLWFDGTNLKIRVSGVTYTLTKV